MEMGPCFVCFLLKKMAKQAYFHSIYILWKQARLGYKILRSHSPKEFCKALAIGTCLYQKSDSHQLNQCEYESENANYDVGHTYGMI